MQLEFTKMQSLGNDFVVIDGVSTAVNMTPALAARLGDRHFGVGCDQILIAERDDETDFRFRIFNQDGSEVEQCGNGARCFARFLIDRGLTDQRDIAVRTVNTRMRLTARQDGSVSVDMGAPIFAPTEIPFDASEEQSEYTLNLVDGDVRISALSMGNPHAVMLVEDVNQYPVLRVGAEIGAHGRFPAGVNAGFMQIVDRGHIRLRVFERGAGETLGCGSGACAAVVAGIRLGRLDRQVTVSLPGGDAVVEWHGQDSPVILSGSAHTVFCGKITLPAR